MYTIYLNDTILYYPGDKDLCLSVADLGLAVGESGEFGISMPPNNPTYNLLKERQIITIFKDDEEYWRGDIRDIETDFNGVKALYCLEDLAFLGEVFKYSHSVEKTYSQYFIDLINEYNSKVNEEKRFSIGYILKNPQEKRIFTFETMSILEILREIADDYYVRVRRANGNRYIDIVDLKNYNNGHISDQPIQFGDNMMDFVKESNSSWLLSAILPVGADLGTQTIPDITDKVTIESVNHGSRVLVNETAVANYGYIEKLVEFEEALTPEELMALATQYLTENSQPRLTMEIQAIDLSTISDYEAYNVGDLIPIVCEPFGIDQAVSVCKLDINLLDPSQNNLTLSSAVEKRSFTDIQNQISSEVKKMPERSEMLTSAKRIASNLINAAGDDGHVVLHENEKGVIYEILIMNTTDIDTATKMWRWNENGFGYREKTDGEWNDYKTAITMDGQMVADFITAGILQGIEIIAEKGSIAGFNITKGRLEGTSSDSAGIWIYPPYNSSKGIGDSRFPDGGIAVGVAGVGLIQIGYRREGIDVIRLEYGSTVSYIDWSGFHRES